MLRAARKEVREMANTSESLTMEELIAGLGDIQATTGGKGRDICQTIINILLAFSEEGAKTAENVLDIIHDYRLQAKQYAALQIRHEVAAKPFWKDSVWHCPDCNGRVVPNHSFCHRCGKKLSWK